MPLKSYIVEAHTHNAGMRHFRVSADSVQSARTKVLARSGIRNITKVMLEANVANPRFRMLRK